MPKKIEPTELKLIVKLTPDAEQKFRRIQRELGRPEEELIGTAILAGLEVLLIAASIVEERRTRDEVTLQA